MADPIHQFEIVNLVPLGKIGNFEFHFTNSAAFMMLAVGLTALLMLGATPGGAWCRGACNRRRRWPTTSSPT